MKTYKQIKLEDTYLDRSKLYTKEEVYANCFEFFKNPISSDVFINKYMLWDNEGNLREKDPYETYERVAWALSSPEEPADRYYWFEIFKDSMINSYIHPQGSPMAGCGNMFQLLSLSNCFVGTPPRDSIDGINESIGEMSNCQKRRGGWGTDLGKLRPAGAPVKNAARTSTGAWQWANSFSNRTREIGQGGRRGALMLTYPIDGMDAFEWATMKKDQTYCTGANVSFRVFDKFMQAVENNESWELKFETMGLSKIVKAKDLYKTICESAVETGDPGMLFWDTITKNLPLHRYEGFEIVATNPCGEVLLSVLDSCRLISLNMSRFVYKDALVGKSKFDESVFEKYVKIGMRMSDNLVELEALHTNSIAEKASDEPNEKKMWLKITENAINGRRIGLGIHGLSDFMSLVGHKFANKNQLEDQKLFIDNIFSKFKRYAYEESVSLAKERGKFPIFDWSIEKDCEYYKIDKWLTAFDNDKLRVQSFFNEMSTFGRRNGACLTCAPTGTTSIVSFIDNKFEAGVSSGIEPVFLLTYVRRKKINDTDVDKTVHYIDSLGDKWQEYIVIHPLAKRYIFETDKKLYDSILLSENKIRELSNSLSQADRNKRMEILEKVEEDINNALKDIFTTSAKCNWKNRIELQGIIQKHIDHSLSSTINLPNSLLDYNDDGTVNRERATKAVMEFYMEAWKHGLKGQTVYVDGSKSGVLLSKDTLKKQQDSKISVENIRPGIIKETHSPIRPKNVDCDIHHVTIKGDPWIVLVGLVESKVFEVFAGKNIHNIRLPQNGILHKIKSQNYELRVTEYYKYNGEKIHFKPDESDKDYISLPIAEFMSLDSDESSSYLISKALQHGTPLWAIIDMANKMPGSVVGFTKSVSRVLKKYLNLESVKLLKCSNCGSNNLAFESGCFSCLDCGHSKC
jgi:ribonucleoside-diphosphate reductase alpha chain